MCSYSETKSLNCICHIIWVMSFAAQLNLMNAVSVRESEQVCVVFEITNEQREERKKMAKSFQHVTSQM